MTAEQIERLRQREGKSVKITCSDGELLEAKIIHVDDEHQDAVFDLVSSTNLEKYPRGIFATYVIHWADIMDFE